MDAHQSLAIARRAPVSPTQMIAIGLVVASIGWATWLLRDRPDREEVELLAGTLLPSSELAIMEAAFDRAQLTDYRSEGGRVWVPRARQSAYMRALVDAEALPREFGGSLRRALENNSPWQSKAVQAEMLRVATQDELALVICSMPGIERAAVLYDVDNQGSGGLRGNPSKTASVSVRTQPDAELGSDRIEAIRVLVASSIAGLTPDRVAVTDLRTGRVHAGPLEAAAGIADVDPSLARRVVHERHLAKKVQQAISFVKGATVDVTVEFEPVDRGPTASVAAIEPESEPLRPTQPAAAANAPAEVSVAAPRPVAAPAPPPPPVDVLTTVRVAIAIPESHLAAVAASGGVADRELERIRSHVLPLLPLTADPEDRTVVVTSFAAVADRRESAVVPHAPEPPAPPQADGALAEGATDPVTMEMLWAQAFDAVGRRLNGTTAITRKEWLAGMSVSVGLLAALLWWVGSRRPAVSHPSIDWSRPRAGDLASQRGSGADRESLDRAAA